MLKMFFLIFYSEWSFMVFDLCFFFVFRFILVNCIRLISLLLRFRRSLGFSESGLVIIGSYGLFLVFILCLGWGFLIDYEWFFLLV